jgi:hypothetical protein
MQLVVRAFPILPGKEQVVRDMAQSLLTDRAEEAADFYARFGVARESWHLQETPAGTWVIGVTQIPETPVHVGAMAFSESAHPFDAWFKEQVRTASGIDPDKAPLGPATECIFDTHDVAARLSGRS